jgi:hypothetical protein
VSGPAQGLGATMALAFLAVLGCSGSAGTAGSPRGRIEAQWTGSDTGRMTAEAAAIWCAEQKMVHLAGLRGDTGLALLIFPEDSTVAGRYGISAPAAAKAHPPAAAVALRLLDRTAVLGYQSEGGSLTVERGDRGRLSGGLVAELRAAPDPGKLTLRGRFTGVPVRPGGADCGP